MADDDIIPLRRSYALSMVERISELEAEVQRLRAEREDIDAIHYPVPSGKHDEVCNHCIGFWPCTTHLLLHPEEARRG